MRRAPPSERKAWIEARELFDRAHDELMRQIEKLANQVAEQEEDTHHER